VETQFDWLELPDPPAGWNAGKQAHLLVGALSHSARWRGVLAPSEDFGHTVAALDQVARRLDGLTRRWRFDRMATVCYPASGRVTPAFASVAKYYAVAVDICPPRRGNRKGVVEKANHAAAQRWWRTVGDDVSIAHAQADMDRLSVRLDGRRRVRDGIRLTVGELAGTERLRAVPATPFPAEISEARTVTPQGLVSFAGNQYSVPPGLSGARVEVRHRLGGDSLQIATSSGTTIAAHRRRPDGAGAIVRASGHVIALEKAVLAAFSDAPPCKHKTRRPRSVAAAAEAARLTGHPSSAADRVVIDLAAYAALVPAAATRAAAPTPIRKETQ
jgi:hypothetical protein